MPDIFNFVSRNFWLLALGFALFNFVVAHRAASRQSTEASVLEAVAYVRKFALASAIPWVIMGVGQLSGATPTVWQYFRPQDGSPFVLAWLASIFVLSCVFAWWALFANGAEVVAKYNLMTVLGQRGTKISSVRSIKLFALLGVLVFPVWVYMAVSMNVPLPR
ncbi:MAG: hypothetical protein PHS32_19585 [Rhodoferax sp.]|uniref:hypothetical protein n=1 Tax=Rhodoferax sp. TaxID=50421 RepID=UPI002621C18B|nr:hypothetical protein [Rhodoferax sp.]MDD5335942.1 hypothetical protein [Rhodoferax sp.]